MIKTVDNEAGTAPISDLDRDEGYMMLALEQAALAEGLGEVPVGAVVVSDGIVIGRGHNRMIADQDPTAHAEIVALRQAAQVLKNYRVVPATLYVTLEPCAMCAGAISLARIRRLYFSAEDPKGGAVENGPRFFTQATCHHAPEVYGGLRAGEAAQLLKDFFQSRR